MPIDASSSDDPIDEVLCTTKSEYRILLEMKLVGIEFSSGSLYVCPAKSNSFFWNGIFFVRKGAFKNAILRFTLQLEANYPNQQNTPILKVQTPIEHPLISPETKVFETSHAFPTWNESEHLYSLLKYFKYTIENLDSLPSDKIPNPDALESLQKNSKEFQQKAHQMSVRSVNEVFALDDDENCFTFDRSAVEENEEVHQSILDNMKNIADNLPQSISFLFDRRSLN